MLRSILLLALFAALLPRTHAQSISGLVHDAQGQPAPLAVLKLLSAADSSFEGGTLTDSVGRYQFTAVRPGTYRVQASFVGQGQARSDRFVVTGTEPVSLPLLRLQAGTQVLSQVTVAARKPIIEQQVDKTVLNVAADATAAGKTAYEVLQQAPGVLIDPNENLQLAGKQGVNVYLDGKPANLSSADLANLLKATPASSLATVELITNPSARYDAQGTAGIINLRFRRGRGQGQGINGSLTAGHSQSTHGRSNLGADFNARLRVLNVFGNGGLTRGYQLTRFTTRRAYDTDASARQLTQTGFDTDGWRSYTYRLGADYAPDSRQTLGLLLTGNGGAAPFGTQSRTDIGDACSRIDTSLTSRTDNPARNDRFGASLNYQYADTLGFSLTADADYTRFSNQSPSTIASQYALPPIAGPVGTTFDADTRIRIGTLKLDLSKRWKASGLLLDAGLKRTQVATDNQLLVAAFADSQPARPDTGRSNTFRYDERVSAGYATLTRSRARLTAQVGLRVEYSRIRGVSTDLRAGRLARPDTGYLNAFPSAFVQYQVSDNGQLGLNYGRRIERPNYQDMNPFVYQTDPYSSQRGNPYLRPQYTHAIELSYTYRYATTIKLSASRTSDLFTELTRQQDAVAYRTVDNVGQLDALTLSVSSPFTLTSWWSGYVYAGATLNHYTGDLPDGRLDTRAVAANAYMQHSLKLPHAIGLQVSGFYSAPTRQLIFRNRGLGSLSVSVQKRLWHDRATLTLGADDLLNTMRWQQSVAFGSQSFEVYRKWESRRVKLQLTYRFGNQSVKAARDRSTGNDAGRIRVRSAE